MGLLLGLGVSACANEPGETCEVGMLGCECFDGGACAGALTCMGGVCVLPDGADTNDDEVEPDDDESTGADDDGDSTGADDDGDSTSADDESTSVDESTDDDPTDDTGPGACGEPEVLLFRQDAGRGGTGAPASAESSFFVELADDFTIPVEDSCWCLSRLVVRGYFEGAAVAMPATYVGIYNDEAGKPGGSMAGYEGPSTQTMGDFTVELPGYLLPAGKRWISFGVVLDPGTTWYWAMENATSGSAAQVRIATDSLYACPPSFAFAPLTGCWNIPGGTQPSLQFDLYGVADGPECI